MPLPINYSHASAFAHLHLSASLNHRYNCNIHRFASSSTNDKSRITFLHLSHFEQRQQKQSCGSCFLDTRIWCFHNMSTAFPRVVDIQAVFFDVDGTLCDSDPLHYLTFRQMLQEVGFQDGVPITEEFFSQRISGKHNDEIGLDLFPDWDEQRRNRVIDDKEALFRKFAKESLKPVKGLHKLAKWIEERGIKRAAVTNAPRLNAELMISQVALKDFFQLVVLGSDCGRPKPFPDPYLKAMQHFTVAPTKAFALEDSPSGIKAAVAAGLPVVGITTRNPAQALLDAGATFLINDFDDPVLWNHLESSSTSTPAQTKAENSSA